MHADKMSIAPEHTAVRVALWRALHIAIDAKPHVLADDIGRKLVGEEKWRERQDMNPEFSKPMRASVVGRARFIEDLVEEQAKLGVAQYVILGAGLDTFAQRRPDLGARLQVFEVDQPGPQEWKQKRLAELGFAAPEWLHFVPVDFEAGQSWWERLLECGFDPKKPAVIVSTGVSMYLTAEANRAMFEQIAKLASGSTFAITFLLSLDLLDSQEKGTMEFVMKKAKDSGTPFLSLFAPLDLMAMAKEAGFRQAQYVPALEIFDRYFANRTDRLKAGNAEAFLVASN